LGEEKAEAVLLLSAMTHNATRGRKKLDDNHAREKVRRNERKLIAALELKRDRDQQLDLKSQEREGGGVTTNLPLAASYAGRGARRRIYG